MTVMVESPEDLLLSILGVLEASKSRSGQTHISPSMVGGCRAKAWLTVHQAPATNPTKVLAAHMGSAIHDWLANGVSLLDPLGTRFLVEHPVSRAYPDRIGIGGMLKGTLDLYDRDARRVLDWKTSKKANLGFLSKGAQLGANADRWPSSSQWWQVHLYAWMLQGEGYPVDEVTLVGISRDGDEDHVRVALMEYNASITEAALEWIGEVLSTTEQPYPEKSGKFCQDYCGFYTPDGSVCAGIVQE